MQTLDHDQLSVHIGAPPEAVYALVADITRTPEFSPEILRCTWLDGATGPAAGARFEAVNKVTRGPAWKNRPVVIAAQPGREFAFSRTEKLSGTLVWRYLFEPDCGGTRADRILRSHPADLPAGLVHHRPPVRLPRPPRRAARRHEPDPAAHPRNRRARHPIRAHTAGRGHDP
jgi:hypothetical protein